ncbi:MAG: hypothetical protein SGPRY_009096 [Prymnesium sp.]
MADSDLYNIRPSFREKFRPAAVKPLITSVLADRLADKTCAPEEQPLLHSSTPLAALVTRVASLAAAGARRYNPELTAQWTREIADEIKNKLKMELDLPRYKYVVQVLIGEQRGEGVRVDKKSGRLDKEKSV